LNYDESRYEEAYQMRENGKDDDTIRMILVSKKISSAEIDAIFLDLHQNVKPQKIKEMSVFDEDAPIRKVDRHGFRFWMYILMGIGGVLFSIGVVVQIQAVWFFGLIVAGAALQFFLFDRRDKKHKGE